MNIQEAYLAYHPSFEALVRPKRDTDNREENIAEAPPDSPVLPVRSTVRILILITLRNPILTRVFYIF